MGRFKTALAACALAVTVTGCAMPSWLSRGDPTAQLTKTLGVRPDLVVTADIPQGSITAYSYRKGDRCGQGVQVQVRQPGQGGGSGGEGSCQPPGTALDFIGGTHWTAPDGTQAAFFFGRINNPKVARVVVLLTGGIKVDAVIQGNGWYLIAPGQDQRLLSVEGVDKQGNSLPNTPS